MVGFYYETTDINNLNEVLSLAKARKQLKTEDLGNFDDTIIQDCIDAAVIEAENYTNTAIHKRTFQLKSTCFLQGLELRKQKVTKITKVVYVKDDATVVTLSTTSAIDAFVELLPVDKFAVSLNFKEKTLPALKSNINDAVIMDFEYGYAQGEVPKPIIQAIKLYMTNNYNVRNNIPVKRTTAAEKLLKPYMYIPVVN